mgnify:CR=1 FL=1
MNLLLPLLLSLSLYGDRVASISNYSGNVAIKRSTNEIQLVTRKRTPLFNNDIVKTSKTGTCSILFTDGSRIDLNSSTLIKISTSSRSKEIAISEGSLTSDIKKISGSRTTFRTPSGIAAVKGTVVDIEVKTDDSVDLSADLGMLTYKIDTEKLSTDINNGNKISVKQYDDGVSTKSIVGTIKIKIDNLISKLTQDDNIKSSTNNDKISIGVIKGNPETTTLRDSRIQMSKGDEVEFVQSAMGMTVTVITGQVIMVYSDGSRYKLDKGETSVEKSGIWSEPETPEGNEVQIIR